MDPRDIWANLEHIHSLSARELYDNPELEELHRTCRRTVYEMSNAEQRETLSRFVRDEMLSEAAIARGDGWEDVLSFLDWVDGGME